MFLPPLEYFIQFVCTFLDSIYGVLSMYQKIHESILVTCIGMFGKHELCLKSNIGSMEYHWIYIMLNWIWTLIFQNFGHRFCFINIIVFLIVLYSCLLLRSLHQFSAKLKERFSQSPPEN